MKTCPNCGETKPLTEFHVDKRKPDGRVTRCKTCVAARDKARNTAKTPDEVAARNEARRARYREDQTFAEKCRQYAREVAKLRAEHKRRKSAEWRKANPVRHRENARAWQKANPAKARAIGAHKRAAKTNAVPPWADHGKIAAIYEEAATMRALGVDVHVDHIVPLQGKTVCGLHVHHNLRLLLAEDNAAKGNHHWPDMP